MASNFKQPGCTMTFTAPTGGVVTGGGYLIGGLFAIASITAAQGQPFEGTTEGVWTLPKTISEGALVVGQAVFWDVTNARVTIDPSLGLPIGAVAAAALTSDTVCDVRLNGVGLAGRIFTARKRFTIAQVNAGAVLVPAMPGVKVRMVDAMAISVGGAASAVTTVDIIGTLAATPRKLVAFGQAALTQSAVVRAGGTGGTVLADGASFTANDAGAAVTVGKTGSDVATATHIDVAFTYSIE